MVLFTHERLEDRRRDVRMIERRERIADVVDERAGDVFVVAARLHCQSRRQQRMPQPVHREAAEVAVQQPQVREYPLRQRLAVLHEVRGDDPPILGSGLLHAGEGRDTMIHCGQNISFLGNQGARDTYYS